MEAPSTMAMALTPSTVLLGRPWHCSCAWPSWRSRSEDRRRRLRSSVGSLLRRTMSFVASEQGLVRPRPPPRWSGQRMRSSVSSAWSSVRRRPSSQSVAILRTGRRQRRAVAGWAVLELLRPRLRGPGCGVATRSGRRRALRWRLRLERSCGRPALGRGLGFERSAAAPRLSAMVKARAALVPEALQNCRCPRAARTGARRRRGPSPWCR
mmetsp:Transcript_88352/g.196471  ORF Transcript_88352/g.196471 Transcript_88352/m.196471 type:complete len:210 (-) Transcript_88352:97-726(-)